MKSEGYYVMKGNTSIAWYPTKEQAQKEVDRILMIGAWSGTPPRIIQSESLSQRGMGSGKFVKKNPRKRFIRAWTGGDTPKGDLPAKAQRIYKVLLNDQLKDYRDYWKSEPNDDTLSIFKNRARLDAWRTYTTHAEKLKKNPRKRTARRNYRDEYIKREVRKSRIRKYGVSAVAKQTPFAVVRRKRIKRNPVKSAHCYRVYQSSRATGAKNIHMRLADFPPTPKGKKDAIAYARAYHRAYPKSVIGVAKY